MLYRVYETNTVINKENLLNRYQARLTNFNNFLGFKIKLTIVYMNTMDIFVSNNIDDIVKGLNNLAKDNNYIFVRLFETTDFDKDTIIIDIDCATKC